MITDAQVDEMKRRINEGIAHNGPFDLRVTERFARRVLEVAADVLTTKPQVDAGTVGSFVGTWQCKCGCYLVLDEQYRNSKMDALCPVCGDRYGTFTQIKSDAGKEST